MRLGRSARVGSGARRRGHQPWPSSSTPCGNDVADLPARADGANCLHHCLLSADALQRCVRTDSIGEHFDAGDTFIAALGYDVR
jgi:hypothetical protein